MSSSVTSIDVLAAALILLVALGVTLANGVYRLEKGMSRGRFDLPLLMVTGLAAAIVGVVVVGWMLVRL